MSLVVHLILRLIGIVALCLACAVGWVLLDSHRAIETETVATADRVTHTLENLYWRELLWHSGLSKEQLLPVPDWETLTTMKVIAPGVCVTFSAGTVVPRRLCSQLDGIGTPAPAWFKRSYESVFGTDPTVERPLSVRQRDAGTIAVTADPGTAIRQAWRQISIVVGVAAMLAIAIGVLGALVIGYSLMPTRTIIGGLRRLERGDYSYRLPVLPTAEFNLIARAVNDLTCRLAETTAQRLELTNRLFQVQEEERRALARDLHDEFGQCLAGIGALAAAIEAGAGGRPELVEDARKIAAVTKRMSGTLKGALARLRSQEVDELGLEASLAQLVAGWNVSAAPQAVFHLDIVGNLADLPLSITLSIYRIAQECLTNAVRHGKPRDVRLHVERMDVGDGAVSVSVEDDGGGTPSRLNATAGFGILGMRERVAALGGRLSIGHAAKGVRVSAFIPLMSQLSQSAALPEPI